MMDMNSYRDGLPPLDPKCFHILVSVAGGPSHGYAIRKEVESRTDGAVRLWPATLYGTLAELVEGGLLVETPSPAGEDDDPRRRYYALTAAGQRALAAEASRLEGMARTARRRLAAGSSS